MKVEDSLVADLDDPSKPTAERRVWNAVILLAVSDAKSSSTTLRHDVAQWIQTPDFEAVCGYADQDPGQIKRGVQKILAGNHKPLTDRQQAKQDRNQKVLELRQSGSSLEAIAGQVGLSRAGVAKIVDRHSCI